MENKIYGYVRVGRGYGEMFCAKCGTQISESDQFCPKCGKENINYVMSAKLHRNILDGIISGDLTEFNDSFSRDSRQYDYVPLPDRDWE